MMVDPNHFPTDAPPGALYYNEHREAYTHGFDGEEWCELPKPVHVAWGNMVLMTMGGMLYRGGSKVFP